MRAKLAYGMLAVFVVGYGLAIAALTLPSGYAIVGGEYEGMPLSNGIVAFSVTVASFIFPVLLNIKWWVMLGLLAAAFRVVHCRQAPDISLEEAP